MAFSCPSHAIRTRHSPLSSSAPSIEIQKAPAARFDCLCSSKSTARRSGSSRNMPPPRSRSNTRLTSSLSGSSRLYNNHQLHRRCSLDKIGGQMQACMAACQALEEEAAEKGQTGSSHKLIKHLAIASEDGRSHPGVARPPSRSAQQGKKPTIASFQDEKVHLDPRQSTRRGPLAGVPVYVMLPLDSINPSSSTVNRRRAMDASLRALKSAGVEGVMMDVWWGIVEKDGPGSYNWSGYRELIDMVHKHGLKVQAVMSFHQCGGNVGDSCTIPLPRWVVEEIEQDPDLAYTDKQGRRNYEYLSLGCDTLPVLKGRSPVQVYADYMRSFRDTFSEYMGHTIVEIQVGMGPAGELRYPSYPESNGTWRFPGIGEFQCYDKYMLSSLKASAVAIGKPEWGLGGPCDAGHYNNWPEDTDFFRREGGWNTAYGEFFLEWYSNMLLSHGERILSSAEAIFRNTGAKLSGKVAGIHWHYGSRSHPAELTAGYYNTRFRDGYLPIAAMFGRHGVVLNFTCIEMKDYEQPSDARCSPENLIKQVVKSARKANVPVAGENALMRFDEGAYKQVIGNSRLVFYDDDPEREYEPMCAFTFLRMSQSLFQGDNWRQFVAFVRLMAVGRTSNEWEEEHKASELVHAMRPLVQEAAAALA